ncbi:thermonuclease family protein [Agrobacterium sp. V1]|uniref:thermonuclease family protein n=1 Tax=Agrobacterium sp. V1 TaxID=3061957 RepID=UPI00267142D5|nr:thermonuclease family protein [Agrobacterium sp. V1]MDO3441810.1 thermonuclease family protein [Agrobacterium sp. V1]
MSFVKVVAIGMVAAFSVGAGVSYYKDMRFSQTPMSIPVQTSQTTAKISISEALRNSKPYTLCSGSVRRHCVVDGDTIWHDGTKIRIADIDTPEVGDPKCGAEAALGAKATKRLLQLVNAGPFEMKAWEGRDEDRYGRKLRVFVRDGRSLGDILVSEGLARTWTGRRQPWC